MSESNCEVCDEPNMGGLIDPMLRHCCIHCVEEGEAGVGEGDDGADAFRAILTCGCGRTGPSNYSYEGRLAYFCGSSERCIP